LRKSLAKSGPDTRTKSAAGSDSLPGLSPHSHSRFVKMKYMVKRTRHKAAIPNPALKPFNALVGEWKTVGTHPGLPDTTLHGHTSFAWLEGGAFLIMHSSRRFRVESQSSEAMTLRMSFLCFILMSAAFPENTGRYCLLRVPQSRVPQMSGGGVCKRRSSILSISCRGFSAASRYRIRPAPRGKRAALHTALYSFRSHILLWILRADTQKTNA
jgi:hypothetical protein